MEIRVLIPSGAGAPGFGGIFECLSEIKNGAVFCGDMDTHAYGRKMASGFEPMPPSGSPQYLDKVLETATRFSCNVLLPITTHELPVLSKNEELIASAGINLAVSPYRSMLVANDKAALYAFLQEQQLPCVAFEVCTSKEVLINAAEKLGKKLGKLAIKPALGNGGRGFRIIVDEQYQQQHYFAGKFANLTTTLPAMKAELPEFFDTPVIVSEYLPGQEYSVDAIANRGQTLGMALRLRKKIVSGISVAGEFVNLPEIEEQVRRIIGLLELHGPIGLQFKENTQGFPLLLEINPRLQGAVSGCRAAGLNFPKMAVELALGNVPPSFATPQSGSFNRYWKDIF